jgi:hypothetical protein
MGASGLSALPITLRARRKEMRAMRTAGRESRPVIKRLIRILSVMDHPAFAADPAGRSGQDMYVRRLHRLMSQVSARRC